MHLFFLCAGVRLNLVTRFEQTYELLAPMSVTTRIYCPLTNPLTMSCSVASVATVVLKPFSCRSFALTFGIVLWILPYMDVCFSPHFKQPLDRHDTQLCFLPMQLKRILLLFKCSRRSARVKIFV